MTREEAKLILGLFRPDQDDPADALFAEALRLVESDQELALWFEAEKAFDARTRDAVRQIAPPPGLRESLLAENKILRPSFFSGRYSAALAIAAVLVALVGIAALMRPSAGVLADPALAALALKIPALTALHDHSKSSPGDMDVIRAWLAANGGQAGFTIPNGLKNAAGVACEVTEIEGKNVTILCFEIGNNRIAHLYVVETPSSNPGTGGKPAFFELDGVSVATWHERGLSYFLAERGPIASVRGLL